MSSTWVKIDSSDLFGDYLVNKLVSSNGSIAFNVTDPLADGNKVLDLSASVGPYAVYAALLTSDGTNDPIVVVLANTLGSVITWTYDSVGRVRGRSSVAGIFSAATTGCLIQESMRFSVADFTQNSIYRDNTTDVYVETVDKNLVLIDGVLNETLVEIRVYTNPPNVPPAASVTYVQTAINYTTTASNKIVGVTNTAANRDITLLAPASYPVGQLITIKDESGGAAAHRIRVIGAIDGMTNFDIDSNYGSITLYSNGVDKYFIQATK